MKTFQIFLNENCLIYIFNPIFLNLLIKNVLNVIFCMKKVLNFTILINLSANCVDLSIGRTICEELLSLENSETKREVVLLKLKNNI